MRKEIIYWLFVLPLLHTAALAQDNRYPWLYTTNPRYNGNSDSVWINSGVCKTLLVTLLTGNDARRYRKYGNLTTTPLLTVHGNIQYDFTYRSLVDTPFTQKDFRQHSVQSTLDIVVKDKYPFRVTVLHRNSNSPYFDNITDVNLQFQQSMFLQQVKNQLNRNMLEAAAKNQLAELENRYEQKKREVQSLQQWMNGPARLQEMIRHQEAALRRGNPTAVGNGNGAAAAQPSLPGGSALPGNPGMPADHIRKHEALTKAEAQLKAFGDRLTRAKTALRDSLGRMQQQLAAVKNPAQLKQYLTQHPEAAKQLPGGWKLLGSIQQIGLGRTLVDYTELTVKNISLTGINVEMNPSKLYLAFAAGKVNYRFRDFVVRSAERSRQSLYLLRAGLGKKEGNNLIFTWYEGKRNLLNSFSGAPVTLRPERVMGVSLQGRLQLDDNHYVVLESAKSSFHNTGTVNGNREGLMNKVWNFRNRTNEAYSINVYGNWPQVNTKITGFYRRMGENFQSFNLQPVNVAQEAYQLRLQKAFWKRRLAIDAGLRKNDFANPLVYPGISSKTVFKSIQASLRVPKYPFLSVGYFPSSQLTVLDNNVIAENQYQTFNAVASHNWRMKQTGMSTNVVYLKFFNNSTDTGFIYYNAESWTASQIIFLKKAQLQSGLTITRQRDLRVFTLEQSLNWQAGKWLSLTAAIKHNRLNRAATLWGGTAGLGLQLKHLGQVQASFDRSYLPGTTRNLLPVDMGRISFYKTF